MPMYAIQPRQYAAALGLEAGDRWEGLPIVASPLGSPHLLVLAELRDLQRLQRRATILPTARPALECHPLYVGDWPPPTITRPWGVLSFEDMVLSWRDLLEDPDAILSEVDQGYGLEVVVCDTGVKPAHEFWEEIDLTPQGELTDTHGHGSFVASQIARLLPQCAIRSVRVLDQPGGSGSEAGIINKLGLLADLAVRDPRPRVCNNSWGADGISQGILDAYKRCLAAGVTMTCAAGNSGPNVPIGTPAAASPLIAGAYDWRSDILASFSSGGDRWPELTGYWAGVDEWGIGIGGYNHYHQSSGTSMADPYLTALCGILRLLHPDWTPAQMAQQLKAWAQPLAQPTRNGRGRGYFPLAGLPETEEAPLDPAIYTELANAITEAGAVAGHLDTARYDLRDTDDEAAWTYVGEGSRIQQVQQERLLRIMDMLPKVEPPVDPPVDPPAEPAQIATVYGTYSGHGQAKDAYPGLTDEAVQWGAHHNVPLVAPADGRVEVYPFGTPLGTLTMQSAEYQAQFWALFDGWVCQASPQQTMYVAVFWPATDFAIGGQHIGHLHYGHVRSDVRTGPVRKGEVFAHTWDSGVRFEPQIPNARAAHVHCCAGRGANLSPNGDLDGTLAIVAQGWTATDLQFAPGPTDYQSGRWCAGRLLTDFHRAQKPIPPMPS